MTAFAPRNPDYEACVRDSFARQHFMTLIGAVISRLVPGEVDIELPNQLCLTQQHGFFHAGATSSIAEPASGYAALSLFAPGNGVLTTEFKINLLAPAKGDKLIAPGQSDKNWAYVDDL